MVEYSTPLHDRDGECWTDLVDEAGEPLQQHIPASPTPPGGSSEMGWSYVLGPLACLHVWHGLLSYRVVWSRQVRICPALSSPASSWRKCPAPAMVSGGATFWKMLRTCSSQAPVIGSPSAQGRSTGSTPHQGRHVQDALAPRKTPPTSKRCTRVAAIR